MKLISCLMMSLGVCILSVLLRIRSDELDLNFRMGVRLLSFSGRCGCLLYI